MNKPTIERLMKFSREAAAAKRTAEGGSDQRLVRCAGCVHWGGHEYPPAFDKAYCAIFDKYTTSGHGEKCTAWEAPNGEPSGSPRKPQPTKQTP